MNQESHTPPPMSEHTAPRPPKKEGWRVAISTLGIILAAIIVAFLVMMFVFRSYQVEGPSMEPTLHNNDRLIIWKFPRTWARITGDAYIPNRGDIIVFAERGLAAPDGSNKQLIKRVIGLPGDRVVIEDGKVTVINEANPSGFSPDTTLPYGEGQTFVTDTPERIDELVDENEVFVLGDNRGNSLDSRYFGPISADDIVGKLLVRMYPISEKNAF